MESWEWTAGSFWGSACFRSVLGCRSVQRWQLVDRYSAGWGKLWMRTGGSGDVEYLEYLYSHLCISISIIVITGTSLSSCSFAMFLEWLRLHLLCSKLAQALLLLSPTNQRSSATARLEDYRNTFLTPQSPPPESSNQIIPS